MLSHLKIVETEEKGEVTYDGHEESRHYDVGNVEGILVLEFNLHLQKASVSLLEFEFQCDSVLMQKGTWIHNEM